LKSIYTYYKERLVEISGKNRSLFSKKISKKNSFDIGKLFDGDYEGISNLIDFLWKGNKDAFTIISKDSNDRIAKNLGLEQKYTRQKADLENLEGIEKSSEALKLERKRREEVKRAIISQVSSIKALKREIEEFEKETGRYELYVGYPFVQGYLSKDVEVKAPLVLFPVTIDVVNETTVNIEFRPNENILLNKVLILAYAQRYKLKDLENLDMEFKGSMSSRFKGVPELLEYLKKFGIKISYSSRKGLFDYEKTKNVELGQTVSTNINDYLDHDKVSDKLAKKIIKDTYETSSNGEISEKIYCEVIGLTYKWKQPIRGWVEVLSKLSMIFKSRVDRQVL